MAYTLTISINDPVLPPGETFDVSYLHLLTGGAPVALGPKTNEPFTISDVLPGDYEIYVEYEGCIFTYCVSFAGAPNPPPPPQGCADCPVFTDIFIENHIFSAVDYLIIEMEQELGDNCFLTIKIGRTMAEVISGDCITLYVEGAYLPDASVVALWNNFPCYLRIMLGFVPIGEVGEVCFEGEITDIRDV